MNAILARLFGVRFRAPTWMASNGCLYCGAPAVREAWSPVGRYGTAMRRYCADPAHRARAIRAVLKRRRRGAAAGL